MSEELNFNDLKLIEVPVTIEGKKYTLRETDGEASVTYDNALLDSGVLGPDGKTTRYLGLANRQPLLVSLCLFDESGERVPEAVVRSWPGRVQKRLFAKAREISRLDDEDNLDALIKQRDLLNDQIERMQETGDPVKKSPGDTPGGSA